MNAEPPTARFQNGGISAPARLYQTLFEKPLLSLKVYA